MEVVVLAGKRLSEKTLFGMVYRGKKQLKRLAKVDKQGIAKKQNQHIKSNTFYLINYLSLLLSHSFCFVDQLYNSCLRREGCDGDDECYVCGGGCMVYFSTPRVTFYPLHIEE